MLLLFTLLNGSEAAHSVKDSCDAPFDFVEFRFELKHAVKNERNSTRRYVKQWGFLGRLSTTGN